MGAYSEQANLGWWSLYVNPEGTALYFSAQAGGRQADYLKAPIQWPAGVWHEVLLSYTAKESALSLDGALAAVGSGVSLWPSDKVRAAVGFTLGSAGDGSSLAQGEFDELTTYRRPPGVMEVDWVYRMRAGVDLILASNSTVCGEFVLSLPGVTLSGPDFFCSPNSLPEARLRLEVGRTYTVAVSATACGTRLNFSMPDCYRLQVDRVPATSIFKDLESPDRDCHTAGNGAGSWSIQLSHTKDLGLEFDVPRLDDHYVLTADGVSAAHSSIKRTTNNFVLTPSLTWSILSADKLDCQIDPTNGTVRAGERTGSLMIKVADAAVPPCEVLEELELRRCDACGASDCEMGSVEAEVGSAHIRVSLGGRRAATRRRAWSFTPPMPRLIWAAPPC